MVFNETNPTKGTTMEFNLHKSMQWAFIDGVACGVVIAALVMKIRKDAKEKNVPADVLVSYEEHTSIFRR